MSVKTQTNSSTAATREGGHVLEMQRRRLLLAYSEVLAEHGLQGASVDRICKRAGVSRRTFYDLFLDREGCFLAALELARERIVAEVVPEYVHTGRTQKAHSTQRVKGWYVRLRAGLTVLLELFDSEPALARMCVIETLKGGPEVLAWRRAAVERLVEAVDEGRGEGKGATPPLTAEGAVGGVLSVIHTRLLEPGAEPLVALVNPLMSMIVHPYLGPAAAARELSAIGDAAGVADQGQISKLLRRLERCGLVSNSGEGHPKGEPNAWTLTERGEAIQHTIEPAHSGSS